MGIANTIVSIILRSPLHPLLSGSTAVVRYVGRMSTSTRTTPVQYATQGDGLVVFVANPEAKRWWRNFRSPHAVDMLVAGTWRPFIGRVVDGRTQPGETTAPLAAYLRRFPKAARLLPGTTLTEQAAGALLVVCVPRFAPATEPHASHLAEVIASHLPHVSVGPEPDPM